MGNSGESGHASFNIINPREQCSFVSRFEGFFF